MYADVAHVDPQGALISLDLTAGLLGGAGECRSLRVSASLSAN